MIDGVSLLLEYAITLRTFASLPPLVLLPRTFLDCFTRPYPCLLFHYDHHFHPNCN
jgi:hypothetical protein